MNMEASSPTSPTVERSLSPEDFPSPPALSPEPPESELTSLAEDQDFPAPPPPPSTTYFPAPPTEEETMPGEDQPQTPRSAKETLSFDNPLANISDESKYEVHAKVEDSGFDFTDADAAIDKMLDDLADFQDVRICL